MSSSSSSVRRLKERGGSVAKITPLKPQKTLTENPRQKDALLSSKKPAGKENPRPASGAGTPSCQKQVIRMQKPPGPAKDGESRVRWSTSSVPKGKSSNTSDFSRILLDLRSGRVSRVSGPDRVQKPLGRASVAEGEVSDGMSATNGFRVLEKCQMKKSCSMLDSKGEDDKSVDCLKGSESCKISSLISKEMIENGARVLQDHKERIFLVPDLDKNGGKHLESSIEKDAFGEVNTAEYSNGKDDKALNVVRILSNCKEDSCLDSHLQGSSVDTSTSASIAENSKSTVHADSNFAAGGQKSSNGFGASGNPRSVDPGSENKGRHVVNKYPSKLHEKLAYLESKVKRIASDIKRTKEMLDMNDPDASKLILLDIQDKISGIEKAMGHVTNDSRGKLGSCDIVESDRLQSKHSEKNQDRQAGSLKNSSKSLNNEELEARLFPHHKLLRSRASFGSSTGKDQIPRLNPLKVNHNSVQHDPIDENPIALEFLASLDKNYPKINSDNRHGQLECDAIKAMDTDTGKQPEAEGSSKKVVSRKSEEDIRLTADENFEGFDDQENNFPMTFREAIEDSFADQLREIGRKSSTGGWFVSEGESALLVHDDSSCSFYDIANSEEKSEYKPPPGVAHNLWADCWLIRAADSDGCSGRFVVAASAGNTLDSGFCSWDFYTKDIRAFRVEDGISTSSRTVLGPLPNKVAGRRDNLSTIIAPGNQHWWYKPSGPLLVATASCQKVVSIFDIRDGDLIMKWEVQRPVLAMDYSSPLQWRNKGKVVIAETEAISLWDVNTLNPESLLSVSSLGKRISALHVNNTEAELGGGIRRRVSSAEVEGNDGVFCTQEAINVLDFRLPSGVGVKISKHGMNCQSIFSNGDSIFLGGTEAKLTVKEQSRSLVQQFSLRKGQLLGTYTLPESNAHLYHSSITQVWGDTSHVMAVSGLGLFVFDTAKDDAGPLSFGHGSTREVREVIGPDDLYCPSFDFLGSRVLLISRDRPALWKYLS